MDSNEILKNLSTATIWDEHHHGKRTMHLLRYNHMTTQMNCMEINEIDNVNYFLQVGQPLGHNILHKSNNIQSSSGKCADDSSTKALFLHSLTMLLRHGRNEADE